MGYPERKLALSVSTSFDYSLPVADQLQLIASAGFTHVSLGGNADHGGYRNRAGRTRLARLLDQYGLRLDTIHGPRVDQEMVDRSLATAIGAAADLGAPVVVAHTGPFDFPADELAPRLVEVRQVCVSLEPLLARTGIVLALENVLPGPATELVRQLLPQLDPRFFGFCYDSCHDQINGPRPFDLLAELDHRVRAVHLSDRIREFVDHVPPGEGFIDWDALCPLLRASSFAGPLLFEVMIAHAVEQNPWDLLTATHARGCELFRRIYG